MAEQEYQETPPSDPGPGPRFGVRPFGKADPHRRTLPTRRDAAMALAAAGVVSPFAPGVGRGTVGSQIVGNATPEAIRRDSAGSFASSTFSIPATQWIAYPVERPTLLVAVGADDHPNTAGATMSFWYTYGQIPAGASSFGQSSTSPQWAHAGVAYLGATGTWWLRAQSGLGNKDLLVYVIDAFEWPTAFKWLSRPGANLVLQSNVSLSSVGAVTTILSPHPGRIAARLQSVNPADPAAATANIRLSFDQPASYLTTGAAWTNKGYRLVTGEHIDINGDFLTRGTVNAITEHALGGSVLEVLDYYDWL